MEKEEKKPEPKKEKVLKVVLSIVILILAVLLVREIIISFSAYSELKKDLEIIENSTNAISENVVFDSVKVKEQAKAQEQEKMKKLGISEENINEVVIKNGSIFNYEKLEEFYNEFLSAPGICNREANETLKVIYYKDDTNYDEVTIHYEVWPKNEVLYDGKVVITANGETYEDSYNHPIWIMPLKDDEGELFIEYYYVVDGNKKDLFKYRLDSTPYHGDIDFRFTSNGTKNIVEHIENENPEKDIYVIGGSVKVFFNDIVGSTTKTLKESIEEGLLSYEKVLSRAEADSCYRKCYKGSYLDGICSLWICRF